jgi:uncharacterized protein YukE
MAKADVDPEALRRFAKDLNRFNTELQSLMAGLHARMLSLERTWRDQEQRKFLDEFQHTMKTLSRFLESSDRHVGFLTKKAGHIEQYLQQR